MMILTFLKLAATRFEFPSGRVGQGPTEPMEGGPTARRVVRRKSADGREWLRLALEGGGAERPKDELARFSLTSPEANSGEKPDPERWM